MKHRTAIVFALLAVVSCGDTHDGIDVADDRDALSLWDAAQGFQEWKRAHDGPQTRVYVEVPGVLESPQRSDEAIAGSHVVVTSSTIDSGDAIGVYEFIDDEVGWRRAWFDGDGSPFADTFRDSVKLCVGCHQGSNEVF